MYMCSCSCSYVYHMCIYIYIYIYVYIDKKAMRVPFVGGSQQWAQRQHATLAPASEEDNILRSITVVVMLLSEADNIIR